MGLKEIEHFVNSKLNTTLRLYGGIFSNLKLYMYKEHHCLYKGLAHYSHGQVLAYCLNV